MASVGVVALALAALFGIATWVLSVSGQDPATASSDEEFQPTLLLAFIALLTGLALLGIATRRTRALGDRWSDLPLGLALSAPLVGILGGVLEGINERLLEVPLVLFGCGWIGLGYALITAGRDP